MLSGEGKENGEKTTIGLITDKKATLHAQHTFFVHFFAVVLHDFKTSGVSAGMRVYSSHPPSLRSWSVNFKYRVWSISYNFSLSQDKRAK